MVRLTLTFWAAVMCWWIASERMCRCQHARFVRVLCRIGSIWSLAFGRTLRSGLASWARNRPVLLRSYGTFRILPHDLGARVRARLLREAASRRCRFVDLPVAQRGAYADCPQAAGNGRLAKRTVFLYATPTFWLRGYGMSVIWAVDHPTWKRLPRRTGTIFTFLRVATYLSCKMDCEMVRRSGSG